MSRPIDHSESPMPTSGHLHICVMSRAVVQHQTGGGMELIAEVLRHGMVERGHRVTTITTPHPQGMTSARDEWGETLFVGTGAPGVYTRDWWRASMDALLRVHAQDHIDVLVGQGKAAYAYLGARRRLPAVDRIPTTVITHNTIISDLRAQLAQLRRQPKTVARWAPHGVAYFLDDRRRLPLADAITALTEEHARSLRRWFSLDPARVTVIPNGVDLAALAEGTSQRASVRQRLGADDQTRIIMVLARLAPDKGQQHLLDAVVRPEMQPFRRLVRVVLVGDGPARDELVSQATALGLRDSVVFVGRVPHGEVPGLLAAADLVVLPSISEGMSLSLLESMASGRAVIASNIPAIASVVEDGVTGVLVPVAQPAGLARALAGLLANPQRAVQLGAQAHAYVAAHFDQRAMVAAYEGVFLRAAGVTDDSSRGVARI